jgi:hypothetical protein
MACARSGGGVAKPDRHRAISALAHTQGDILMPIAARLSGVLLALLVGAGGLAAQKFPSLE